MQTALTSLASLAVSADLALRSTHAVIDLDAVAGNVSIVREALTPGTALVAVVKGNGYGHGATMVARTALESGAAMLAVATVGEGQLLRQRGLAGPILVLGPANASEFCAALEADLALALCDAPSIETFAVAAAERVVQAGIHLKVDTGMHRYGCSIDDAAGLAAQIAQNPHLRLAGVFTHFAEADAADDAATRRQVEGYQRAVAAIENAGIEIPLRHVANSAGTLRSRDFDCDAIRLGIAMYGLAPSSDVPLLPGMRPAMTLRSRVARIHELAPGERVSYGGTYVADAPERIALIPCGYADGYPRAVSNRGWAGAGDARLPIRGRVCMDQMMVGLPADSVIQVGDVVSLLGDGSDAAPTAEAIGADAGTINYEIVTRVSARVPRVYTRGAEIVAIEDMLGLHER
jgi:alanine racemase